MKVIWGVFIRVLNAQNLFIKKKKKSKLSWYPQYLYYFYNIIAMSLGKRDGWSWVFACT